MSINPINSETIDQIIASMGDCGAFCFTERTPVSFAIQSITLSLFTYAGVYFKKNLDPSSSPVYQLIFLDYMTRVEVTPTWNSMPQANVAYYTDMRSLLSSPYMKWFKFFSVKPNLTSDFRLSSAYIAKPPGNGHMSQTEFIKFILGIRSAPVESTDTQMSNSVQVIAAVVADMQYRGIIGTTPGVRTLDADFNVSPDEVANMFIGKPKQIVNVVNESTISVDEDMNTLQAAVTDEIALGIQTDLDSYYTAIPAQGFPVTGTSPYTFQNSMIAKPEIPSEVIMREFFLDMVQKQLVNPVLSNNFPINSLLTLEGVFSEVFDDNGLVYFKAVEDSITPLSNIVVFNETRLETDRRFMADFFGELTRLVFTPPTSDINNENFISGSVKGILDLRYSDLLSAYVNTSVIGMMTYQLSRNNALINDFILGPVDPSVYNAVKNQNTYLINSGNAQTGYSAPTNQ